MQSNPERIGIKTHSMRILFHSSTDVTDIRIKYSLVIIWFHEYPDISMVGMQTWPTTKKKHVTFLPLLYLDDEIMMLDPENFLNQILRRVYIK